MKGYAGTEFQTEANHGYDIQIRLFFLRVRARACVCVTERETVYVCVRGEIKMESRIDCG